MENIFLCYTLPGYFYNPIYRTVAEKSWRKPDLRKTLRWKPLSQTDRDNRLDFQFYNNNHPDKQHGAIEGVAFDGRPVRLEKRLQ